MLVYPPCIDFALVFISCLRAGIVPVPVYPPSICFYHYDHNRSIWNQEECSTFFWDSI